MNPNIANATLNIVQTYGEQRVSFVLANTLHQLSKDGRFSERNKQWGKTIKIPENIRQGVDLNRDYIINSHPAVLNVFIDLIRKEFRDRNLEETLDARVAHITENTKDLKRKVMREPGILLIKSISRRNIFPDETRTVWIRSGRYYSS